MSRNPSGEAPAGLLPSAKSQAAMGAVMGAVGYGIAKKEASAGADTQWAAKKGVNFTTALFLYGFTVFPVGMLFLLWWPASLPWIAWKLALSACFIIITARLVNWHRAPANVRLKYSLPTWVFVLAGGLLLVGGLLGLVVSTWLTLGVGDDGGYLTRQEQIEEIQKVSPNWEPAPDYPGMTPRN
ncbi:hypothetical protein [Rhabdothermincola salaria]|uniref:hypothetical protein n=1 Tax=Rhabdothermincola salaria TaxID=2903142 RepID=UPI001E4BDCDE|nr:hypothetical protein [Rhabdothermincola salaria]MCD9624235.1 hypothetical protein [Rhabdothermincola salaria]